MVRMPLKRQARAWQKLRLKVQEMTVMIDDRKRISRVREMHRIEKAIAELDVPGANEQQVQQAKALRRRLSEM